MEDFVDEPPATPRKLRLLRLFLAIEATDAVRAAVLASQRTLRQRGGGAALPVRWFSLAQSHLTLQFFGTVLASHVPALVETITPAVAPIAPFLLRDGEIGAFPSCDTPRVLWLGLGGDLPALVSLQHAVAAASATVTGVVADRKPFNPHLTLGRVAVGRASASPVRLVADALSRPVAVPPFAWEVGHVSLIRSVLSAGAVRYTVLATFPLGGKR